jgi:membrane protein implicated in regulation of membrane protease activity
MTPAEFIPIASHIWQSTLFAAAAVLLTLALRRMLRSFLETPLESPNPSR